MRVAMLIPSAEEARRLQEWIAGYSQRRGAPVELYAADSPEAFRRQFRPNFFRGVLIGAGDVAGFLEARRVRELDRECRLVVIDDTDRYAIQCHRLHAVDFLIRPLDARQVFRGMDRILYGP